MSATRIVRPGIEELFDVAEDHPRCRAAAASLLAAMPIPARVRARLQRRYDDPALPYHSAVHVGLLWLRHLAHDGAADDLGTGLAILFHDAIYRPLAGDNEVRSAALLRRAAGSRPEADWAAQAILATSDHLAYAGGDARVLRVLDLDLSPLAEHPALFARNTAALRREAAAMGDAAWVAAQRRLLGGFMRRRPLFRSALAGFYEAAAQANLARLLSKLEGPEA